MAKITIAEALKLVPVKKTALYGDINKGVLSAELDSHGRKIVDTAELERVYGQLKTPNANGKQNGKQNGTKRTDADNNGIPDGTERTETNDTRNVNGNASEVDILKAHVELLTVSLETAETRAEELKADKKELGKRLAEAHKMLSAEQEKTRLLMLTDSEHGKNRKKHGNWLGYFRLKR